MDCCMPLNRKRQFSPHLPELIVELVVAGFVVAG